MASANPNIPDLTIPTPLPPSERPLSLSTLALHADDPINTPQHPDVAPALHLSTTFRYPQDPDALQPADDLDIPDRLPGAPVPGDAHVYSRVSAPNTARLEAQLTAILGAPSLAYASGLAAFHALLVQLHPKVVAIGQGYHGCHGVLAIYRKLTGCRVVDLFDETTWEGKDAETGKSWSLGQGDVVHLETPLNPTGTAFRIEKFAKAAHRRGAWLTLDATFAPPPLQDPWRWGADFVMHSGTKYFGGHSDLLCGVLAVGRQREGWEKYYWGLFGERLHLGAALGNLEGWLGIRSLRTLDLRVRRQSETAGKLVEWLAQCLEPGGVNDKEAETVKKTVSKIEHASLQKDDMDWLLRQMPVGFGPVFGVYMKSEKLARRLPSKLEYFTHATSLGGVESLIEWRRMSDQTVVPELLRLSIGVEGFEDLKADLVRAFKALAEESIA